MNPQSSTRRPRIVVASSGLGHVARGIESWANDLAAALFARGESVTLAKGGGTADKPYEVVLPCLQRESRRTKRLLDTLPPRLFWRLGLASGYSIEQTTFAVSLVRLLSRLRAEVLHVQDPQVAILVQRARRLKLVRARTILAHGTEEPLAFLKRVRYLQHLAPWHLEQAKEAGVWRPEWTAIPNFIDTARFAPGASPNLRDELGIPRDAVVVLTAAAIKRHHKRIDHLLREFAGVREARPDLPVWFVVAGGWEQETDELVAEGERLLGDRVRFLVRFPRSRMPELYRSADLFVLGSLFEMMPIALIEATSSGLPCVVHRHPVLEWMTGPGGTRIDMAARGELTRELVRLASDSPSRRALGGAAREHCLANFSEKAVVDRIIDYYQRVVLAPGEVTGHAG